MPTRVWEFELRGKHHSVELEHTHWTGRRTIKVDGEIIYSSNAPLDFHAEDWFNIDSIPCTIRIRGSEVGDYKLFVEGKIIEPVRRQKQTLRI
jgi:hypothetical protein